MVGVIVMSRVSTEELGREVAGEYNTFRVYLYMLRKKRARVRDVQRDLGFSSPRLAAHHLEKLKGLGLVEKENFHYQVVPKSFGVLKLFFVLDRWILPKTFFLVVVFLTMTVGFLILLPEHPYFQVALILSVVGLAVSVYLTVQFYRSLPET